LGSEELLKTYVEKLKDPRWQKKRLEVFERDKWTCLDCQKPGKTLHVHHKYYVPKTDPWDYPLDALMTLCPECHEGAGLHNEMFQSEFVGFFTPLEIGKLGMAIMNARERGVTRKMLFFEIMNSIQDSH
jgi:hypothetical protein